MLKVFSTPTKANFFRIARICSLSSQGGPLCSGSAYHPRSSHYFPKELDFPRCFSLAWERNHFVFIKPYCVCKIINTVNIYGLRFETWLNIFFYQKAFFPWTKWPLLNIKIPLHNIFFYTVVLMLVMLRWWFFLFYIGSWKARQDKNQNPCAFLEL